MVQIKDFQSRKKYRHSLVYIYRLCRFFIVSNNWRCELAYVAPPVDKDMDYFESQGSILTYMACGEYFVRYSSRQRYCNNPNWQAEWNNQKARTYYERKKSSEHIIISSVG